MSARSRPCEGQLSLPLFGAACRDPEAGWLDWLVRVHGCRESDVLPYVRRLFREFGAVEAGERCKVLRHFFWRHHRASFDRISPEQMGLYEPMDHHVLWDRCWAVEQGMDPAEAIEIDGWDYGRKCPVHERRRA